MSVRVCSSGNLRKEVRAMHLTITVSVSLPVTALYLWWRTTRRKSPETSVGPHNATLAPQGRFLPRLYLLIPSYANARG